MIILLINDWWDWDGFGPVGLGKKDSGGETIILLIEGWTDSPHGLGER